MKNKKTIWAAIGILVLACVFAGVYLLNKPKTSRGSKHVVLEVKDNDGFVKGYETDTNAAYLADLMDELKNSTDFTYEAENGDYGLFVTSVNNLLADYDTTQCYWAIYVNGEYGSYGISEQPVTDGDTFTLAYEQG